MRGAAKDHPETESPASRGSAVTPASAPITGTSVLRTFLKGREAKWEVLRVLGGFPEEAGLQLEFSWLQPERRE